MWFKWLIERVENILRKGENACELHFLLIQKCFPKPSTGFLKLRICVAMDKDKPMLSSGSPLKFLQTGNISCGTKRNMLFRTIPFCNTVFKCELLLRCRKHSYRQIKL